MLMYQIKNYFKYSYRPKTNAWSLIQLYGKFWTEPRSGSPWWAWPEKRTWRAYGLTPTSRVRAPTMGATPASIMRPKPAMELPCDGLRRDLQGTLDFTRRPQATRSASWSTSWRTSCSGWPRTATRAASGPCASRGIVLPSEVNPSSDFEENKIYEQKLIISHWKLLTMLVRQILMVVPPSTIKFTSLPHIDVTSSPISKTWNMLNIREAQQANNGRIETQKEKKISETWNYFSDVIFSPDSET